ncbi:FR47-like protein [Bacteriovorax sp. BAL6_X]|uniref:GNAT family N-acetyltransferase n=1 Tax=Bacteriovorax sp. BAL6_X TaxID=1201290 RepID=UPI000386AD42|nr:GNAT family N-acetyltransferase [Bacteriovorax sp. BAL6_X]EPZ52451.1 FR47-like protein [Bacteriovorax sp. BAL6_X]
MFKKLIPQTLQTLSKASKEYNSYCPFVLDHKSRPVPEGIKTRYARYDDAQAIARIISENNIDSNLDYSFFFERTKKELARGGNLKGFHLIVAILDEEVVGYGRSILYTQEMVDRYKYKAPIGWYLMGLTVLPEYRGCGIGDLLTQERLRHIGQISTKAYYVVNEKNKTSIKMHEKYGFKIKEKGPGFLKIAFNDGLGILYECSLINRESNGLL